MNTTVPIKDPAQVAAPSTQEVRILSGGEDQNYLLFTIRTDSTLGPIRRCLELALPIMAAADFGTTEFPFPPAGTVYFFANSSNSNKPSTINDAGTVSVVGENLSPTLTSLLVTGETTLRGAVKVASSTAGATNTIYLDKDLESGIYFDSSVKNLNIGSLGANITTIGLDALNIKIGTKGGTKLGFFNTTPVVQPTVTAAAPVDLATAIAQITELKTALDDLGIINLA